MYDAAVTALSLSLVSAGGWLRRDAFGMPRGFACVWAIGMVPLCFAPPLTIGFLSVCPAALWFAVGLLPRQRTRHVWRLLLYAVICGLAGWQLSEWFPLGRFEALPLLLPALLYAAVLEKGAGFTRLLLLFSPQVSLLCRYWMDRFLFGYGVLEIGNRSVLLGWLAALLLTEGLHAAVRLVQSRIVRGIGEIRLVEK